MKGYHFPAGRFIFGVSGFAIASIIAGSGTAAFAQQAIGSQDIVVTAQKREQRLQDVGVTVSAITAEVLANKRISNLSDIAQAVPGLIYTQSQSNTPIYTLRGVGFFESSIAAYPDVAMYLDQAPLPLPVTATLVAFDLERLEVLKGPQGTLFGNNATGGAINFIAAKPLDHFEVGATIGYGRFGTMEAGGYVTGPLSDTLNARIAVKSVHSEEWQRSYSTNARLGQQDNIAGRILLDWTPTERLKFALNVNGWINKNDPQAPQYYKSAPQNPAGTVGAFGSVPADLPILNYPVAPFNARAADFGPVRPKADDDFWQSTLRTDFEVTDNINLTAMTSYLETNIRQDIEYDGTVLDAYDIQDRVGRITSFSQELRFSGSPSRPLRWVLGGNYERTIANEDALALSGSSTSAQVNQFSLNVYSSDQRMRNLAGFANLEFDVADGVTLKGGARYTSASRTTVSGNAQKPGLADPYALGVNDFFNIIWTSLASIYPNFTPVMIGDSFTIDNRLNAEGTPLDPATYGTAGFFNGKLKEDNLSWSLGVEYKPARDVLLYANLSKGYKAGSFPLVAAAAWSQLVGITQESLLDYEVGFKTRFADRKITLNGAAFYYDYKDKQVRSKQVDGVFGLLDGLVNVPKSTVKGFELETNIVPVDGLTLNAAVTYLDAKVKSYNGVVGAVVNPATGLREPVLQSYAGARLPFAPKWQVGGSIQYEFPIAEAARMFVGGDVSAQTSAQTVLAVTDADRADFRIPGRALFGANAGFRTADGRKSLTFWGRNIFNKYYVVNALLAYDNVIRYAGRPAEYGATLSIKL